MALFKINGRRHFSSCVTSLRKIKPAIWVAESSKGLFEIEGGRKAGGSRRDWYLDQINGRGEPAWIKAIHCTSLTDAIRCIEEM